MLDGSRNRTNGSKGATSSVASLVKDTTIFKFNTQQCHDDPEKALEAIEECCVICGTAWDTNSVTIRYWDSLDGPWIDDWEEATNDHFFVEIEADDS